MRRKSAGPIIALACAMLLLAWGPAVAQGGDQLFQQAEQALAGGDGTLAVDLYSQAIRSGQLDKQKLATAFLQRGRAQQLAGQHARAVADFTNSLWLESLASPDQAKAHGWRAASREALGQGGLAKDDLAKAKNLDAQFAAAPLPAAAVASAPVASPSEQRAQAETSSGDTSGFFGRLLSTGSSEPDPAPARATRQASNNPTPEPEPEASSSSGGIGAGLISALFGSEEETRSEPADSGVTVRRLEPAPAPAPVISEPASRTVPATTASRGAGSPDILARVLATPENAERTSATPPATAGGIPVPRAKPRATAGGDAGPVRLASFETEEPAPARASSGTVSRSGIMESLFGSSSSETPETSGNARAAAPAAAPSATPETISVSESRVASAPPWTLGADNPSPREESRALPAIPTVTSRASTFFAGRSARRDDGRANRVARAPAPVAVPAPARTAPAVVATPPVRTAAATPAPLAIPAPVRTPVAGNIPAPAPAPAPAAVVSTPEPVPAPRAEPRATNVAKLDWGAATEITRAPPPPPAPVPAPVVRSAPAPAPAPVARRAPVPTRSAYNAPAPTPVPVPVRRANLRQAGSATAVREVSVPRPVRTTAARAPARPVVGSGAPITSQIFAVANEAFSGNSSAPAAAVPQRVAAVAPPPPAPRAATPGNSGGGGFAVQVSAQRTLEEAKSAAGKVAQRNGDLFGGIQPYIVRADLPGKGTYYRVRVGPYSRPQTVAAICQQLKSRGTDCFTVNP